MIQKIVNKSLKSYSYIKIGGRVKEFCTISTFNELIKYLKTTKKYICIGNSSKLLFAFEYLDFVIIKFVLNKIIFYSESFFAYSGISLFFLQQILKKKNITGFEYLMTIPGLLGGSIVNNASFLNQCISDLLIKVLIYENGEFKWLKKEECGFAYRYSKLNGQNFIIIGGLFQIKKDSIQAIEEKEKYAKIWRKNANHKYQFNLGSTFKNYGNISIGKTLDELGYKGLIFSEDISISSSHANFLIIKETANYHDIIYFLTFLKKVLYNKLKKEIEEEIQIIDENGKRIITRK